MLYEIPIHGLHGEKFEPKIGDIVEIKIQFFVTQLDRI